MLLGLRTALYPVADINRARSWYASVLGFDPYFDEPFYVGFEVGGFELGLIPADAHHQPGAGGVTAYWGVDDADAAVARLLVQGATVHEAVQDVGGGIRLGTVRDPDGNVLGVIYNPHFAVK